jgi:hypothetical protein
MRLIISIACCLSCFYCIAQNTGEKIKKEVIFNVNLKDHDNAQLFHVDLNDSIPYMINGKVDGHNFLGWGRYTIDNIAFTLEPVPTNNLHNYKAKSTDSILSIKDVKFECFVADFGDPCEDLKSQKTSAKRSKYIAKFKVDLEKNVKLQKSTILLDTTPYIFEDVKLSVYRNAIFDFEIYIDGKKVKDHIKKNAKKSKDDKNFGGHICKSKISY